MDQIISGLPKLGTAALAIVIFFGILLIAFAIASLARGWLSTVLAWCVFLLPGIVLLCVGLVFPAIRTIYLSFFNDTSTKFVGVKNYTWIFTNPDNLHTLGNTFLWIIVVPVVSTAVGLTLALLLDRMRHESVPKSLIFMPMAISFVGASVIWGLVYYYIQPDYSKVWNQLGIMSFIPMQTLATLGHWFGFTPSWQPPNWILVDNFRFNSFLLMIILIWIQTGFAMVVLSAAVKAVPTEVVEAAELDGAVGWRLFSRVTVPMIRGTLIVVFTTIMIGSLKVFDVVRVMTGGNYGTNVLANEMYNQAFTQYNTGRGSAMAVVLFVLVIPLIAYNVVQLRKERATR